MINDIPPLAVSNLSRLAELTVTFVTAPASEALWISPGLPGRTHDLTTARSQDLALGPVSKVDLGS
ncbi:hypothetical protein ACWEP8_38780 [Streptomyces hydrogenans]